MITIAFVHQEQKNCNAYGIRLVADTRKEFETIDRECLAPWQSLTFAHLQRDKYEVISHRDDFGEIGKTILTESWNKDGILEHRLISSLLKFKKNKQNNVHMVGTVRDMQYFSKELAQTVYQRLEYFKTIANAVFRVKDLPQDFFDDEAISFTEKEREDLIYRLMSRDH